MQMIQAEEERERAMQQLVDLEQNAEKVPSQARLPMPM